MYIGRFGFCPVEPQTLGWAGTAQLVRIERKVDEVRRGKVIKHTGETAYEVTSLWPEEAGPVEMANPMPLVERETRAVLSVSFKSIFHYIRSIWTAN